MNRIYIITITLALAGITVLHGDWTTYTTSQGLADNTTFSTLSASDGSQWFGSYNGKVSQKSASWSTHDVRHQALPGYGGYALAADGEGGIWFGTAYGAFHYSGSTWQRYTTTDGLAHNQVRAVAVDKNGNVWFGTRAGVTRYTGSAWTTFTSSDGLVDDQIFSLVVDHTDRVWAGSAKGISVYNGSSWSASPGAYATLCLALAVDPGNHIWAGFNQGGLYHYDGSKWTVYTTTKADSSNNFHTIRALAAHPNGSIWIGGALMIPDPDPQKYPLHHEKNLLLVFDQGTWTEFDTTNGLVTGFIRSLDVDAAGTVWIGTDKGVSSYTGTQTPVSPLPATDAAAAPNPFSSGITIALPAAGGLHETLSIYDPAGRLVRALSCSGKTAVTWDGTDAHGKDVPEGIYLYRTTLGRRTLTGSVLKSY